MSERLRVAIIGASGYTGAELVRLLLGHPRVRIASVHAARSAGKPIAEVFPQLAGVLDLTLLPVDEAEIAAGCDVVFSALPHGEGAPLVAALVARGLRVLDLSADLRLADREVHRQFYGEDHSGGLRAVYGLPERHRAELREARVVAVPGCFPTATTLAIAPLLAAGLVEPRPIIVDAKSGVSGAGRGLSLGTHFSEIGEGIRAYKPGGTHRHTPEIEQELSRAAGSDVHVTFTPHLVPMSRGILSCVYAVRRADVARGFDEALRAAYAGEPFVTVLPPGALPDTSHVRGSNRAHVAVIVDARARIVIAMAAIDNLVKGASGQAVQCLNVMMGWPETLGLEAVAAFP